MKNNEKNFKKMVSEIKIFSFLNNRKLREAWIINKLRGIPEGKSLLDAGAGECQYKKYCSHLKYTSQDFCEYDGKGDGVGSQTDFWNTEEIDIVSDIVSIPVKESSFDYILCSEVLEHIPHPDKAIAEFNRILRIGGKLILTAPFVSNTHLAPFHFCTGFNAYWYREILEEEGFKILEIKASGNYFDHICEELILTPIAYRRYSGMGIFSYLLYLPILPLVLVIFLLSKLTKLSESESCFGYYVLAEKIKF